MATEVDRILGKLKFIEKYLQKLEDLKIDDLEEYLKDETKNDLSRLYLQLIYQSAIDINQHILTEDFGLEIKKYSDTFIKMGVYGVIDNYLSNSLKESAKMRNVLVHLYDKIDYSILFDSVGETIVEYPLYVEQIFSYINGLKVNNNG